MSVVGVHKAQGYSVDHHVPDLSIVAEHELPDFESVNARHEAMDYDAKIIVDALLESLPGGTVDRVLIELLKAKISHFVIPFGRDQRP